MDHLGQTPMVHLLSNWISPDHPGVASQRSSGLRGTTSAGDEDGIRNLQRLGIFQPCWIEVTGNVETLVGLTWDTGSLFRYFEIDNVWVKMSDGST